MWVARDIFGVLELYSDKPTRHVSSDEKYWSGNLLDMLDSSSFSNLTWEDEPLEVELISKKDLEYLKYWSDQAPRPPYLGK